MGFVAEEQTYQVRVMIRIHKKSMQSGDFVGMLGDQNALCNDQNALHCGGALLWDKTRKYKGQTVTSLLFAIQDC